MSVNKTGRGEYCSQQQVTSGHAQISGTHNIIAAGLWKPSGASPSALLPPDVTNAWMMGAPLTGS